MAPHQRFHIRIAVALLMTAASLAGFLISLLQPVLLKLILPAFPFLEISEMLSIVIESAIILGLFLGITCTLARTWQWVAAFLFFARITVAIVLFVGLIDYSFQTIEKVWFIYTLYGMTIVLLTMSQVLFPCWLGRMAGGWRRIHPSFLVGFNLIGFALGVMLYPFVVEPYFYLGQQLLWMNLGLSCTGFLYLSVFFLLIALSRPSLTMVAHQSTA